MLVVAPLARRDSLVIEKINREFIIYDPTTHDTMCLNEIAALVWERCDGKTTVTDIAAKLSLDTGMPIDVTQVWYALDLLEKKNLLTEQVELPTEYSHLTRRDLLRRAGGVGAAVAIPVIISLVAPTPAMAATCVPNQPGCTSNGNSCTTDDQCCSCHCHTNNKCTSAG